MAINYLSQNPIIINAPVSSWRNSQTLNTGTLPGYSFPRQPGIRVTQIAWMDPGVNGSFTFTDPIDSTILWEGMTPADYAGGDVIYSFQDDPLTWRDFSCVLSSGTLRIKYRI